MKKFPLLAFIVVTNLYSNEPEQVFAAKDKVKVYKTESTNSKVIDHVKKGEMLFYFDGSSDGFPLEAKFLKIITRRKIQGFVRPKDVTTGVEGSSCESRHLKGYGLSKVKTSKTYYLRKEKPVESRRKCDPEEAVCYRVTEYEHEAGEKSILETANEYLSLELILPESTFEDLYEKLAVCHLELRGNPLPLVNYKFGEPPNFQHAIFKVKRQNSEIQGFEFKQYFGVAFEIKVRRQKNGKWRIQIYSYV